MKIAFCHHLSLSYGGGGEKWMIELARDLSRRGHDIEIYALPFTMKGGRGLVPEDELDGISYHEGLLHNVSADLTYVTYNPLSWLNFHIHGPKIAGIHSHCYWQPLERKYGILPNLAHFINIFISRSELGRFDAIHTVTPVYPINHKRVFYIPNFVDSDRYHPLAPKNSEFTIGYASRKVWQKGYDIFESLKEELKEINFVETNHLPEKDMPRFLSSNHLTLLPSRVDTFGLTAVESMLCKTPVISSGLSTHRCLGLPIDYATTINDYIRQIEFYQSIFETEIYNSLADNCRESALKYDKHYIVGKIEEMFKEVAR